MRRAALRQKAGFGHGNADVARRVRDIFDALHQQPQSRSPIAAIDIDDPAVDARGLTTARERRLNHLCRPDLRRHRAERDGQDQGDQGNDDSAQTRGPTVRRSAAPERQERQ